jgi:chloramphenicol-sensitive protein RarD
MSEAQDHPEEATGILYAGSAYAMWGVVPLYWRLLADVPPFEITVHRVLWCALTASIVTIGRGRLVHILSILRSPKIIGALLLSSVLVSTNWTIYIWCVATHQLVEASLGYYLTPLVSIALGVLLLGEKISPVRLAAIALAGAAVVTKAFELGHFPWIAPALALTFGFYGYVRKRTPVDSLDGLAIETTILFPLTLVLVSYWAFEGVGAFPSSHFVKDLLLISSGPITAVPLVLFAAGARRVRMTTLGFLQYFSPSITLVVATTLLQEPFTRGDALVFGCVWGALLLVSAEGQVLRLALRPRP